MRARWLVPALVLCGCPQKSKQPAELPNPGGRAQRQLPTAPEPVAPHAAIPAMGVRLPKTWDGYVAMRGDDRALAWADAKSLHVVDTSGAKLFEAALGGPDAAIRGYLVSNGFQPLTPHAPDVYVEVVPKLAFAQGEVRVELGKDHFTGKPLTAVPAAAQPSVAGWAPDERVLVVKLADGAQLGYAMVPVTHE